MTATSSRNPLPMRNALRVVNQNKKMTIVACILQLLGIPLTIAAIMLTFIAETHRAPDGTTFVDTNSIGLYMFIGVGCLATAVFMGMFDAVHAFTELHKKTKVDMLYALPLTGKQRFFSDYLGGCLMYIVPYIAAVLLGWIVLLGMSAFVDFSAIGQDITSFGDFMGIVGKYYALGSIGLLALMLLYYTMSVLITVCCGTLFESIYTNLLLNFLIPGTGALIIAVICSEVGLDFEYLWQSIGFISPIGGLIYLIMLLTGDLDAVLSDYFYDFSATQTQTHAMLPSYFRWVIVILVLTAVLLVAAWQLYVRRKAEDVGKPFIYIAAYHVMLALITLSILCLLEADVIGPAILFSAIVYFVMEVIRKRGFKKFWLSIITYVATVAVGIGAFFLVVGTDCFGRVNYVPAAVGVSSVSIEFDSALTRGYRSASYKLEFTDREVISQVTAFHRDLLQDAKNSSIDALNAQMLQERWADLTYEYGTYDETVPRYSLYVPIDWAWNETASSYQQEQMQQKLLDPNEPIPENAKGAYADNYHTRMELTYYTLAGTTIHRSYYLNADQTQRLYDMVRGTQLYADASAEGLKAYLRSDYSQYNDRTERSEIPQNVDLVINAPVSTDDSNVTQMQYVRDAEQVFTALAEAYRRDLAGMTAEDFRKANAWCTLSNLPIYESCTETTALLRELGFVPFNTCEQFAIGDLENRLQANYTHRSYLGIRIYAPGAYRTASEQYPQSTAAKVFVKPDGESYEDYLYCNPNGTSLKDDYPELYALLGALRSNYVTNEENCYYVNFDGRSYILPAADAALAEAVIAKGDGYSLTKSLGNNGTSAGGSDDVYLYDGEDIAADDVINSAFASSDWQAVE